MLNRNLAVQHCRVESGLARRKHHHEICIRRELQNEQVEARARFMLHANKLLCIPRRSRKARNALLKVLHDVRHALQPVLCRIPASLSRRPRRDCQEGRPLKQQQLLRLDCHA